MEQTYLVMVGIVCLTVLLLAVLVVLGWLKKEQQRTIQKMIDQNKLDQEDLVRLISSQPQHIRDLRRGLLLLVLGLSLGGVMSLMGGVGWMLAVIPIAVGLVYLLLWFLNAPKK